MEKQKNCKVNLLDFAIYALFIILTLMDFIFSFEDDKSFIVCLTFLIIGLLSIIFFIIDDQDSISVDRLICVFLYLFCYYAAFHQYLDSYITYDVATFTDDEYLFANCIILLFIVIYFFIKKVTWKKREIKKIEFNEKIVINSLALAIMLIISIICVVSLYMNGKLFSSSEVSEELEGATIAFIRIERFFPIASFLIFLYGNRKNVIVANKKMKNFFAICIATINLIIYFPLNGTISRYLLFGIYIIVFVSMVEKMKYKSLIILVTVVGFYFVFPAFNFFKTHTMLEISEFELGGFDVNYIDYDAYQLLMLAIRYAKSHGILYGTNILSGLLCMIPRSIFKNKLYPTGQLIGEYNNFSFTNISCPIFAEFYVAGGIFGVIVFTVMFAMAMKVIEKKTKTESILCKGIYNITIGIIIYLMRGAFLPAMSAYMCLIIVYICVYFICKYTARKIKIS